MDILGMRVAHANLTRHPVYRWEGHPAQKLGEYQRQSNDDHRRELIGLVNTVLPVLRGSDHRLDESLLYTAIWCHDDGEDLLGRDVLFPLKETGHDVAEYEAFVEAMEPASPSKEAWEHQHQAFLLQFATKYLDDPRFPPKTRETMTRLVKIRWHEIHVFEFLERIDYLLYALEQDRRFGNPHFVREVLPNQWQRLDQLATILNGSRVFWYDSGMRARCFEILDQYGPLIVKKEEPKE